MAFDADAGAQLAEIMRSSTVEIAVRQRGGGCGIIWNPDGVIVTNAHVVGSARRATVTFHGGGSASGEVVSRDERRDLAEIRVAAGMSAPSAARVGSAAALRVGDVVAAFGAPFGIAGAISLGIVHRKPVDRDGKLRRWVEADVRLAPGNSGGPLMDAKGCVVGVNSMIAYGLALAVPSEAVERFLHSHGARAWIGITAELVRLGDADDSLGLVVVEMNHGGPAARAGVKAGDVIVGTEGRRFRRPGELERVLEMLDPGAALSLDVARGGATTTLTVVTGTAPMRSDRAA